MPQSGKKMTIYQLTVTALMAAVMCILGPLTIPIGPIPITFMNLAICITAYLLGTKMAAVSFLVYLMIGVIGLPVFSGGEGGVGKLLGPTGGFLVGFIFLALFSGIFIERFAGKRLLHISGMALGMLTAYALGCVWFMLQSGMIFSWKNVSATLSACVLPFIIVDAVKLMIAAAIGPVIRKRLAEASLLPIKSKRIV